MINNPGDYIEDLLSRLSNEDYATSSAAITESKALSDVALVPAIRERIENTEPAKDSGVYEKLAWLLKGLISNTQSAEAIEAYKELMNQTPSDLDSAWMYILSGARRCKIVAAKEHALRIIKWPIAGGLALSSAFEFIGTLGGREDVPLLGILLEADCYDICHPMYCVMALAEIEHSDGLPYLEDAVERHLYSRKGKFAEVRYYSERAIERRKFAPPKVLEERDVYAWTLPKTLPYRIAHGSGGGVVTMFHCNEQWAVQDSLEFESHEEARKAAIDLASDEELRWHMRPEIR